MDAVFDDRTAGLIDAASTIAALRLALAGDEVRTFETTRVLALLPRDSEVIVRTTRGDLVAPRAIVAAGAWTDRLVPSLGSRLNVVRQTVGYFAPAAPSGLGQFPVWACLGDDVDITHYGLPEFGAPGLKVGRHVVIGDDDPDDAPDAADPAEIAALRSFVDEQLTAPPGDLLRTEHCLYTCTPTEDFVIDIVRDEPRVVVAAGMSGHGFKFAPLTGRLLAELALDGKTSVPAFESRRPWR
jgi:sarcosine oxidase